MSRVTGMIAVSNAGQENLGVKLEVPSTSVDPGEEVRVYLWGRDADALAGYALAQGADAVGAARLRQYPGQTEAALFDLDGTGGLKAFTWPVLQLLSVAAVGACYAVDGDSVTRVADPGHDVSSFFRLSGNALAPAVGAQKLVGTVRATGARSPWCLEWRWTTPPKPATGLPDGTCTDDEDDRDSTLYWFFLMRFGALVEEFSLELAANEDFAEADLEEEEAFDFGRDPLLWFDARDIDAEEGEALTFLIDRVGNSIELSGRREVWYSPQNGLDALYLIKDNGETISAGVYVSDECSWDGVLPEDALAVSSALASLQTGAEGLPCLRMAVQCWKCFAWGLGSGLSSWALMQSVYSVSRKKTLFVVSAGPGSFASGSGVTGTDAREQIAVRPRGFCGYNTDYAENRQNDGPLISTDCSLSARSGKDIWLGGDVSRMNGLEWWTSEIAEGESGYNDYYSPDQCIGQEAPSLVTLELDGESETFSIYVNGVFKSHLSKEVDGTLPSRLPVELVEFMANAMFYNNTYDTMGVTYATHQDVFAALLFDGLFDEAKRQEIEAYIMSEWGIA